MSEQKKQTFLVKVELEGEVKAENYEKAVKIVEEAMDQLGKVAFEDFTWPNCNIQVWNELKIVDLDDFL
jgi:hypothetical protein